MDTAPSPTWLSLLPALVTITLAFTTRQVIAALFAGILTGAGVAGYVSGDWSRANPITQFVLPAIGSEGYAQILFIYLWCLGGLIGLWEKTGGARCFAEAIGAWLARGRRSALSFAWLLGIVFHQGGTVSTVLTGSTAKPVADRHRVSHEELSYVVDSTASPVATLLAFNQWPIYVGGLVAGTIPLLATAEDGAAFFYRSIPFNFYAWFAVLATLLFGLGYLPWIGRAMARARDRAIEQGLLDAPDARPMLLVTPDEGTPSTSYQAILADFLVPLSVLLGVAIGGSTLLEGNWIKEAFLGSVLSAMVLARARGMPLGEIMDGFLRGCQQMTIGAVILGLAVTLGTVSKQLGTAAFVVSTIGSQIDPMILPVLLTALCMGIAFATGTSWGTYAVVFPLATPLAWALYPDPIYLQVCFGATIGGAVFGDQCSPISDTTILSSMFTGCDLMHHVRTQLPLALAAATLGAACSTIAVALI